MNEIIAYGLAMFMAAGVVMWVVGIICMFIDVRKRFPDYHHIF